MSAVAYRIAMQTIAQPTVRCCMEADNLGNAIALINSSPSVTAHLFSPLPVVVLVASSTKSMSVRSVWIFLSLYPCRSFRSPDGKALFTGSACLWQAGC